jgi:hypothetical protein
MAIPWLSIAGKIQHGISFVNSWAFCFLPPNLTFKLERLERL